MSSVDPFYLGVIILAVVACVLLGPLAILKMKRVVRDGEQPVFTTTGTIRGRMIGGSMVPTNRFDVFSAGILISSIFSERYISAKEIKAVKQMRSILTPYIELKLKSGEFIYLATGCNKKFFRELERFNNGA